MDETIAGRIGAFFAELPDPRRDHPRRHKLTDIVMIAICAVICGAEDWEAVVECNAARREWFGTLLRLPAWILAHNNFWQEFRSLDGVALERCSIDALLLGLAASLLGRGRICHGIFHAKRS